MRAIIVIAEAAAAAAVIVYALTDDWWQSGIGALILIPIMTCILLAAYIYGWTSAERANSHAVSRAYQMGISEGRKR